MTNVPAWIDRLEDRLVEQIQNEILPPLLVRRDLPGKVAVVGEECFMMLSVEHATDAEAARLNLALRSVGAATTDPRRPEISPGIAQMTFFALWERHKRMMDRSHWEGRIAHEDFCEKILIVEGRKIPALTLVPLTQRVFNYVLTLGERLEDGADFVVLRPLEYPTLRLVLVHPPAQASTGVEA